MIRAHFDACLALLAAAELPPTNLLVLDSTADGVGEAPVVSSEQRTPRVVVSPDGMPMESDRLAPHSGNLNGRIYVKCIGVSRKEVQWAQEKTRALLLDKRPVVSGRSVGRLRMDLSGPLALDRDVQPNLFHATDIYRIFSA